MNSFTGFVRNMPVPNASAAHRAPSLGPTVFRSQKGRFSPTRPKRSRKILTAMKNKAKTKVKKGRAVHGLPFGGNRNVAGTIWTNSDLMVTCHDCSGENKFAGVPITQYCPNAFERKRTFNKKTGKVQRIQFVCQCSGETQVDQSPPPSDPLQIRLWCEVQMSYDEEAIAWVPIPLNENERDNWSIMGNVGEEDYQSGVRL